MGISWDFKCHENPVKRQEVLMIFPFTYSQDFKGVDKTWACAHGLPYFDDFVISQ